MAYELDQFISDCRNFLKRDPGPGGREQVRANLERLLNNKDFVEKYCGDDLERGLRVLYEDPELKFQVLAHINDKARTSPPHDHGESWAIYGQAKLWTDMIEWKRDDNGSDPKHAKLSPEKKYRLEPGHAGIYQDGKIHSIDYPDKSRFVRVTGVNLDNINRIRIDLKTGEVHQMTPQQATLIQVQAKPLEPAAVKAMLGDGREVALVDLREELIFSRNHLLWARSVPLSRLELRFPRLVPRKSTRIVLCDDDDDMVQRAAAILAAAGYTDISYLQGGNAAWEKAGFEVFSGVNVPSKAFGEHIEHACHTPNISAQELDSLMQSGTDMVVVDSRPFDEFQRVSIPTATNVPGAELVLRIRDIAPSPDTLVVVNCAGRTRSIIGAQSLINAGLPNKVVALRNGTMGYTLAGLKPDSGKALRYDEPSPGGFAWARAAADGIAKKFGVMRIEPDALEGFRADPSRTLYVFDVRDPTEYLAGHFPGAVNAPGGQLVQATDQYAGTLGARIVLIDDREVRALMTASWLRQMGWRDVFVLAASGDETGYPAAPVLGRAPPERLVEAKDLAELVAKDRVTVVDLSLSPAYRKGHIPGAWYAIRTRLAQALAKIPMNGELILTSEDGVLAGLAVSETRTNARALRGGNAAWHAAGFSLSTESRMADEPLDYWPKPYERTGNTTDAMNEYLSWEVDLLPRIARDGTTRFIGPL